MSVKVHDPLLMLYDADCGLCSRTAQALRLLDMRGRLRILPLQRAATVLGNTAPPIGTLRETLHVGRASEGWSTGGAACLRLGRAIPLLSPLAWALELPVLRLFVEPGYRFVVSHRDQIGHLVGADRCRYGGDASQAGAR